MARHADRPARRRRIAVVLAAVAATAAATVSILTSPVGADTNQPTLPSTVPADYTPNINDGTVYTIAQVGSWIVVGGSFTNVTPHGSSTAVTRTDVLAFDKDTGALDTAFAPTLDGTAQTLQPGPTDNTVYVGGAFNTVNGAKSKGLALLDLNTGKGVTGFKAPSMNGIVYDMRLTGGHLILAGSFTTLTGLLHQGIGAVNPTTGVVDPYVNIQLTGHHNYNGTGAIGALGGRSMDVTPDGTKAIVLGNFKNADGVVHDQIAMIDLNPDAAVVDPNWNTGQFAGRCNASYFDTYVEDVEFSPDGSYFAIAATGSGGTTYNPDGSRSLCDSATRWETNATGTNVLPTWVDYTGNDTFWTITATGTAIYAGGHARWINNPKGRDVAAAGAVPRPGVVALDPVNGLPFSWNPGRNPRGAGAYALLATSDGLYVGSDTDWIGNYTYKRQKIAYFPLAGGETPPPTTTATLPAFVYQAGQLPGGSLTGSTADDLDYRPMDGSLVGSSVNAPTTGIAWGSTRGAFVLGDTLYYGDTQGHFNAAPFAGGTVGPPTVLDPYNDPYWDPVQTGSGQTYQGVKSDYYTEMPSVTGQFYANGRIYYTLAGKTALYSRYFEPDDGVIGETEFSNTAVNFKTVEGMTRSGDTIYYANSTDGTLHTVPFVNGVPSATGGSTVSAPGVDWRARNLFLYGTPPPIQPPTAAATITCTGLGCSFDGSQSSDPDGTVQAWSWDFGDGATGTGPTASHGYATPGNYPVTLTVTDNSGATNTWTGTATPTAPANSVRFVGAGDYNNVSATPTVTAPAGINAGDTELLFVSTGTIRVTGTPTGALTGWTQLAKITNTSMETTVFSRTAQAGDSGQTVTVPLTTSSRVDLQLADYANVSSAALPLTSAIDAGTGTHKTPPASVTAAGSWVLSYWSERSSTTTAWTTPSTVTVRQTSIGTGGGRVCAVLADSGNAVTTGSYPSLTATANSTSGRGDMISIVLAPAA